VTGKDTVSSRLRALMDANHLDANTLSKKVSGSPNRVTITRILENPESVPRVGTLEPLENFFECPGHLTEVRKSPKESSRPVGDRFTGTWYEHISEQSGRDYESIDIVRLHRVQNGELRGKIERIHSARNPTDVGETWETIGKATEERFLYLVFYTVSNNRPDSNGAIALHRDDSYLRLDGGYLKYREVRSGRRSGPPIFDVSWYREEAAALEKSQWALKNISKARGQ
jgi:hypothetical protein